MEFNDLVNKVCKELPPDYDIEISLENGYGGVTLNTHRTDSSRSGVSEFIGDTLEEQLLNALAFAIEDATPQIK
jgi:hypothetical protein